MLVKIFNEKKELLDEYYIDDKLKDNMDKVVMACLNKRDEDYICIIDGGEREGKSVLAQQLATYVDNSFNISRMCFSPDEFRNAVLHAKHHQAVVFDEAYRGFSSKGTLSEINKVLVSLMMEMGQKNLFIIIVLPTFFLLEKYVALWRAKGLFHVHKDRKGRKGFWRFYNKKKKKLLYLKGKKDYSYHYVKTSFRGRFYNHYTLDEAAYREKKRVSLQSGFKVSPTANKWLEQRNKMFLLLQKELGCNQSELIRYLKMNGFKLDKDVLGNIIRKDKQQTTEAMPLQKEQPYM